MTESKQPIDLIYIVGAGHSGSTLLDLMLGSHSQIESLGEIEKFSDYVNPDSNRDNSKRICSCGVHVEQCSYWGSVMDILKREGRNPYIELNIEDPEAFESNNYAFLSAVLKHTKKKFLLDSSKRLERLAYYLNSPLFNVRILHLIRDGRACTYSHKRKVEKQEKKFDTFAFLSHWSSLNEQIHTNYRGNSQYHIVLYENLSNHPGRTLNHILSRLDLSFEMNCLHFDEREYHNLSGNRMRMNKNQGISFDDAYLENIPLAAWYVQTISNYRTLCGTFKYPFRKGSIRKKFSAS